MIGDTIEYPLEGDDAVGTLIIGGALYLLSPLVVPSIIVGGYSVAVCRNVLAGEPEPPAFEDWGQLAIDGLYVVAISLLYWLPALVVGAGATMGYLLLGVALGFDSAGLAGIGFLFVVFGVMLALAYSLVVGYVLPAAIVNYARTDDLSAAWDVDTLRTLATSGDYAKAWVIGAVILFAANSAGSSLVWILVGFLVLFYGQVAAMYAFTRGGMDALNIDPPTTAHGAGSAADTAGDGTAVGTPADSAAEGAPGDAGGASGADATGEDLTDLTAVGPTVAEGLRAAGFETVADVRAATREDLTGVDGIGAARADRIKSDLED